MSKVLSSYKEALRVAEELSADFAATAVERDRKGGTPKKEKDAIRQSGLLNFFIAKELGGTGGTWAQLLTIIGKISRADSSLGHLYAFHNYQLATVRLFGSKKQWTALHKSTVENGWFWGNALNQIRKDVVATQKADGNYEWNGVKNFATGSKDSDYLTITGSENTVEGKTLVAAIPTNRKGVIINDDWDNIGQRQTDSGTLVFENVIVNKSEILSDPGPLSTPFSTARALIGQLIFANLFLSIAQGAYKEAVNHIRGKETKPWLASLAPSAQKDPFILRHIGELWVKLEGARLLTAKANAQIDPLWQKAENLSEQERGEFAISAAAARVAATQVGLELTSRIFEALGSRATTSALGFDRFWRNLRTQTLHDPIDYKIYALGDFVLNGTLPTPTFYS
ncbi:MAG: acyl-CoA dehydrogenase family protein [Campylobacteraceae bacterium]|jgi:alkylation response protein AidB-like acyl-CoA dehydrogenase|nr:acyl-CoA dehydrogenase family protein [Campylobacteraceae bacterium]